MGDHDLNISAWEMSVDPRTSQDGNTNGILQQRRDVDVRVQKEDVIIALMKMMRRPPAQPVRELGGIPSKEPRDLDGALGA